MASLTMQDGTRINYTVRGQGRPAFIFVHGWCSNLKHWDNQARYFGRNHRVLRLDRRGHGRSDVPAKGFTPRQHADDIAAVASRERIRNAIVVGHAFGGPATLQFARTYPQFAKAVVLVDYGIAPKPTIGDPNDPFGALLGDMITALRGKGGSKALRGMYAGFFAPQSDKRMVRQAIADAVKTPPEVAAAELEGNAVDTAAIARRLRQPVLLITASPLDQPAMEATLKRVQVGQVVGSGHFPQMEVPGQVNAMIENFAAQL